MLVAPLVPIVALLLLPLWPVAIVLVGAAWLVVWPAERLSALAGGSAFRGWSEALVRTFKLVLKPWSYFTPPTKDGNGEAPTPHTRALTDPPA